MRITKEILSNVLWSLLAPTVISAVSWGFTWYMQRPEITGTMEFVSHGVAEAGEVTPDVRQTVTTFVTLENQREAPVSPIKYLLQVKTNGGWQSTEYHPYYRKHDDGATLEFDAAAFRHSGNGLWQVTFPNDNLMLTSTLNQPIKKGEVRSGVLIYLVPQDKKIEGVRLRIVDVSDREFFVNVSKDGHFDPRIIGRLHKDVQVREIRNPGLKP